MFLLVFLTLPPIAWWWHSFSFVKINARKRTLYSVSPAAALKNPIFQNKLIALAKKTQQQQQQIGCLYFLVCTRISTDNEVDPFKD